MKKWNPKTGQYELFSPGERAYPPLPAELADQVARIATTNDGGLTYCPCSAVLADGRHVDCVYLVEAAPFIKRWGVWPDQDEGKHEIDIREVAQVGASPFRLPARLAQLLYDAGESGMGGMVFEIEYWDGSRSAHLSGNAVDFVCLPSGKLMTDVVAVHPHEGRNARLIKAPEYFWCLYCGPVW